MSYQDSQIKKIANGKELVHLSVAKEILEIREAIEKNVQHAGPDWDLVKQAYDEIQKAHGHAPSTYTAACSGCTLVMNNLVGNWLKKYDNGSVVGKAASGAVKSKPLVPVKDKKKKAASKVASDLSNKGDGTVKKVAEKSGFKTEGLEYSVMSYGDLLKEFKSKASEEEKKTINKGRNPGKAQLLEYFGV